MKNHGKPWGDRDLSRLRMSLALGHSLEETAETLGRTELAILYQCFERNIKGLKIKRNIKGLKITGIEYAFRTGYSYDDILKEGLYGQPTILRALLSNGLTKENCGCGSRDTFDFADNFNGITDFELPGIVAKSILDNFNGFHRGLLEYWSKVERLKKEIVDLKEEREGLLKRFRECEKLYTSSKNYCDKYKPEATLKSMYDEFHLINKLREENYKKLTEAKKELEERL